MTLNGVMVVCPAGRGGLYSSVTSMLFELGLPSFNTLMHNCKCSFECSLLYCSNMLVCSMLGK